MKLTPFSTLLTESFSSYRSSIAHLIALEVVPLIVGALTLAIVFMTFIAGFVPAGIVITILGIILFIIASVSSRIAMIHRIAHERPTLALRASLEATRPVFFQYVWVVLLTSLAVIAGLILFIIPGIIIAVWFSFSYLTLLLEGKHGIDALRTSKDMVRGLWWPIFWRFAGVAVVFFGTTTALTLVSEMLLGRALSDIIGVIVNLVVAPYLLVFAYHLYRDVKRAKRFQSPEPEAVLA
jgi:hypothetical protein